MGYLKNFSRASTMATVMTISLASSANPARMVASIGSEVKAESRLSHNRSVVLQRRERLQKVLLTLDGIAQATLQLKPETASRLEPVVVDLAEQAIELTRDASLESGAADQSLLKLEKTVSQLLRTLDRIVEPEMSL